jgi:hypothetical protein
VHDPRPELPRRSSADPIEWSMAAAFAVIGLVVLVSLLR